MSANDKQIGGDHYRKGDYQHWDWVAENYVGYLEGNATAYICRWREKKGLEDLEKALHYTEKLLDMYDAGYTNRSYFVENLHGLYETALRNTRRFLEANPQFDSVQRLLIYAFAQWRNRSDLERIQLILEGYILEHSGVPA